MMNRTNGGGTNSHDGSPQSANNYGNNQRNNTGSSYHLRSFDFQDVMNHEVRSSDDSDGTSGICLLANVVKEKEIIQGSPGTLDPCLVDSKYRNEGKQSVKGRDGQQIVVKRADSNRTVRMSPAPNTTEAILSTIPTLPSEPEYDLKNGRDEDWIKCISFEVKDPICQSTIVHEKEEVYHTSEVDDWFPEIPMSKEISSTLCHERLCSSVEPGVVQKLPRCRIHENKFKELHGTPPREHLFCFQVTETYCNNMMLCCSLCSTWRHAECGGHYTFRSPRKCEESFVPICDRCYEEKEVLHKYPNVAKFLSRQRSNHLRKTHLSGDIIRHACYGKYGYTSKWPLGSVMPAHILGHCRSVQSRNDRVEKQWMEMLCRLNGKSDTDTKQSLKDLQWVANHLDEAEGKTDLHNMILFLERDIKRPCPTGFDTPQFNFFDPEEDDARLHFLGGKAFGDVTDTCMSDQDGEPGHITSCTEDECEKSCGSIEVVLGRYKSSMHTNKIKQSKYCSRERCKKKQRFDSAFCSDACGVNVMQSDLLRSLNFANGMHPCRLRH